MPEGHIKNQQKVKGKNEKKLSSTRDKSTQWQKIEISDGVAYKGRAERIPY